MFFYYTFNIYHVSTKNQCGRSSGVERNLAKVEVEGSNPFARSKNKVYSQELDIDLNRVTIECFNSINNIKIYYLIGFKKL